MAVIVEDSGPRETSSPTLHSSSNSTVVPPTHINGVPSSQGGGDDQIEQGLDLNTTMVGGHSQGKGEDNTSTEMTGEARRCPPKKYLQLLLAGIIVVIIVEVSVVMVNRSNSGQE